MGWMPLVLEPLRVVLEWMKVFSPRVLGAFIILVIGWTLAYLIDRFTVRLLQALRVDRLSEKAGLSGVLHRGAIQSTFAELIGKLIYWVMIVATVIVALQFVGMAVASEWLERLGYFIPRLISSIVILVFGMLVASFLGATVRAASLNAGLPQGYLLGQTVYTAVVVLTAIVVLEQLEVVTRTIEVALYILLGAFGLAFALALGLGSQEFVRQVLAQWWERWKTSQRP